MKTVEATIEGICPMLMHRYVMEDEAAEKKAVRKDRQFDPKEDAEKGMYKNASGEVYIPSSWIEATLRDTSKEFKGRGKASMKATILASVFVEPDEILIGKKTYDEIDRRPCLVQRQRIVRSRPKFNPGWKATFNINFDEERVQPEALKQILEEAGKAKGVGDYRPKFGRFKVISFK